MNNRLLILLPLVAECVSLLMHRLSAHTYSQTPSAGGGRRSFNHELAGVAGCREDVEAGMEGGRGGKKASLQVVNSEGNWLRAEGDAESAVGVDADN